LGRSSVRENDGVCGRGIGKKQMGGKPVNVSSSITPLIGERLADIRSNLQWNNIDWKIAEKIC